MSGETRCYGVRRFNPFQGVLQVVELGDARALSLDGVRWEVQVLCAQPEHTWRTGNRGQPILRYFRFGVWSMGTGIKRVPVSPILDLDLLLGASSALIAILPGCLGGLPFSPADRHELWLLDKAGSPFALTATFTQAPRDVRTRTEPWAATARSDHGFQSRRLLERGVPARDGQDPRHHATLLERLVRRSAGSPARACWIERDGDHRGCAAEPQESIGSMRRRRFAAAEFPRTLLREHWPDPADTDLVRDYLDWCAPYLLTLPDLSDAQRDRFEHAAKARALQVETLHRLYPKVLNAGLLKTIRVEAKMRRTATASDLAR